MSLARTKELFLRLPLSQKLIGLGALLLAISTFLPWYSDVDSYRVGGQFSGLGGPTYMLGFSILGLACASLWFFSYHLFERRLPRVGVKESTLQLALAIESGFLLLITNTIYLHPQFGVNILTRELGFGVTLAVMSIAMLIFGGYLLRKQETSHADNFEGRLEPLIKLENADRGHAPVIQRNRETTPQSSPTPASTTSETTSQGSYKIRMDL